MKKNYFVNISFVENGIIVFNQLNIKKEISFSEIKKIYIKKNKKLSFYLFVTVFFSIIIMAYLIWYLNLDFILLFPLFLFILVSFNFIKYDRYEVVIRLKNGDFLKQQIDNNLRSEARYFVNKIRQHIDNIKIE